MAKIKVKVIPFDNNKTFTVDVEADNDYDALLSVVHRHGLRVGDRLALIGHARLYTPNEVLRCTYYLS